MKLNKHGWGFIEMIILILVLSLFLGIAIYYIYSLYSNFNLNPINEYTKLEEKLEDNAKEYLAKYYPNKEYHNLIITQNILKLYNLDVDLKDSDNNSCSGYVFANDNEVTSYIKCPNYTTPGYDYE